MIDIRLDLLKVPPDQRVDLDQPPLVHFQHLQIRPVCALTPSPASDNRFHAQLGIRSRGRLHLDKIVVRPFIRLPQFVAVLGRKLFRRRYPRWAIDVQRGKVRVGRCLCEGQGLGEMV